jgi:SAM-dependent methyltransferase
MPINTTYRTQIVRSLIPDRSERLIDVGCGPITPNYPYADKALRVTCIDWKLKVFGTPPSNIEFLDGDFTELELGNLSCDTIVAADVFEHLPIESESLFAKRCTSLLKPGGQIIISVPHQGTYAFLDPYRIKPAIQRLLWHVGLYNNIHNGYCDIRKGHKHYVVQELVELFKPLRLLDIVYYGYFFDPLLTWAVALSRGSQFPGYSWLEKACRKEFECNYGPRSFNVALKFWKPK